MRPWQKVIPQEDRDLYEKAGFAGRLDWGRRPALLVIDVTLPFLGKRMEVMRSVEEVPTGCGEAGWIAMEHIRGLLRVARAGALPIVYTRPAPGAVTTKRALKARGEGPAQDFPEEILPKPADLVVEKPKASAFFETSLHDYLRSRGVDTILVAGASTSGCVRASVVDGFSHGYTMLAIEECLFDRSSFAHAANLFDMEGKYADVITLRETLDYLASLKRGAGTP